jgi:hypothetical protein
VAKNLAGKILRLIQIRLTTVSFEEISLGCQDISVGKRICLAVFYFYNPLSGSPGYADALIFLPFPLALRKVTM